MCGQSSGNMAKVHIIIEVQSPSTDRPKNQTTNQDSVWRNWGEKHQI